MDSKDKKRKLRYIGLLRKAFPFSELYNLVLEAAKSSLTKRGAQTYTCAMCQGSFTKANVQVDHYPEPFTPFDMYQYEMSDNQIHARLNCDPSNLRVLCKECHKINTSDQTKERSKAKKKRKSMK